MAKKNINDFLEEKCFEGAGKEKVIQESFLSNNFRSLNQEIERGEVDIEDIDYHRFLKKMPSAMYSAFRDVGGTTSKVRAEQYIKEAQKAAEATGFQRLFDHVFTTHMTHMQLHDQWSPEKLSAALQESSTPVPINGSWADSFVERCTEKREAPFGCPVAPATLGDLFARENMRCSQYRDLKWCDDVFDPPPEFCCTDSNEDDPAQFYGLGEEVCWEPNKPCYIHFAFAMHKSLACVAGANQRVRRAIEARRQWFDIIDERRRVRLLLHALECESTCLNFRYKYNDESYPSGYLAPEDNGPWANLFTDPELRWEDCVASPFCYLESVFEQARDPNNGLPVFCGGDLQILLTRQCKKHVFDRALGPWAMHSTQADGTCQFERRVSVPARDGWSTSYRFSPYIWDILVDYYLNCYEGTYNGQAFNTLATDLAGDPARAQATAQFRAENTYVVSKSFPSTFTWLVDFDVSTRTLQGENTWMFFDRGITWMRRYERKAIEMWSRPWLTLLIRGFDPTVDHEGNAIP